MGELKLSSAPRTTDPGVSAHTRWMRRVAIGARIRHARLATRMAQADLARGLTTVAYLSRIEAGERQPSPGLLDELAGRVGADVGDLTRGRSKADDGLAFELAHADLLLASGHIDDAIRVSRDLAEIATCIGMVEMARAANVVRASALAANGRPSAALRILWPLASGPTGLLAMVAQARCHLALGDHRRAIGIGQRVVEQIAADHPVSQPAAAAAAVVVCEAYTAIGRPGDATQVATLALAQLGDPINAEESAPAPPRMTLTGIPFRSFEQAVRQTELAVAGLQAESLREDAARLEQFAAMRTGRDHDVTRRLS